MIKAITLLKTLPKYNEALVLPCLVFLTSISKLVAEIELYGYYFKAVVQLDKSLSSL